MIEPERSFRGQWLLLGGAIMTCALGVGLVFVVRSWPHASAREAEKSTSRSTCVRVEVIHPEKGKWDRTTSQPGSIQAFESVQLYAGVAGYLKNQKVDIGDTVKCGEVIAKVDVPELEQQVQLQTASLEQAKARVVQMQARAESARAEWEAARAAVPRAEATLRSKTAELKYRQQQLERMRELARTKSIEDKVVDEATSHRDAVREGEIAAQEGVTAAKATVDAMDAKIKAADADVKEAEAAVKVVDAELAKAKALVQFSVIKAPFKGVVTQRSLFPGDYVKVAGDGTGRGPLLTVQRIDRMRVIVHIPDRDVPFCDKGNKATVEIDALPGETLTGEVARIGHSEDPDTRTMHVEIDLENPTGKICHGMYGRVTIYLQKSDLLSIPSACLVGKAQDGKGSVYVVQDGRARLTPVVASLDNGVQVGIVGGISAEDAIILHPGSNISDGCAVEALEGHD